ncbi:MAG: mechanosensitive ion channel [Candidatus Gastranaerophilales bacterium]|nr:mechanosensitive ion channel [Candidatus Gastranaerophilales bacterium]
MEELLNLDYFAQFLKPAHIKMIVFAWSIVKCTLLFAISLKVFSVLSQKIIEKISSSSACQVRKQQLITFSAIISHVIKAVIFAIYIVSMLNLFGIDIRPILATAGVMGVAIGFGAKRFVEDVISGIIILLEGQLRVGDYVEIGGVKGFIEKITLPLVTVRSDVTGALCYIRCGYIDSIVNHTMEYSYAFFELDVAYKENVGHVFDVLKKSFDILVSDEENRQKVIGDLEIWGLDGFRESSLCIKCRIKTQPKGQWSIKRSFNKIVKEQFEIENIEIPFNQLVVTKAN